MVICTIKGRSVCPKIKPGTNNTFDAKMKVYLQRHEYRCTHKHVFLSEENLNRLVTRAHNKSYSVMNNLGRNT